MKNLQTAILLVALTLTIHFSVKAQDKKPKETDKKTSTQVQPAQPTPTTPRPPLAFGLSEDTPVKLKLTRTMSSHDAKVDEKVDFEIIEDVKVGDVVVAQHGGMAIATVTEAKPQGRMGKAGKLNTPLDPSRFTQSRASESTASKPEEVASVLSSVTIKSAPDGAEITIDGKLMGTNSFNDPARRR